jgi:hypothetical protein
MCAAVDTPLQRDNPKDFPDWSSPEIFVRRPPDTPISAGEAAGFPRAPQGLEKSLMDSAAVTAAV